MTATAIALITLGFAFAVVRTERFESRQLQPSPIQDIALSADPMVERLSRAVRYDTISEDNSAAAAVKFIRFHSFLASAFPLTHSRLKREVVGRQSLLYTWPGTDRSLKPILLMGHMDVVPADPSTLGDWTYPPFSGRIAAGYIWGRGTMDDKVNVLGIMEAAEYLLAHGFTPGRTVYFAFGHDEETGGSKGAAQIAALLERRQVRLEYVLDEGGNIVDGIIPDAPAPVALIGVAEKGYVSLELTAESAGGHASTPPEQTAIGMLGSAIAKLERSPFPSRLTKPVLEMFEFLGPEMPWPRRLVLANLWLFGPLLRYRLAQSPLTNAVIRTTEAATVFRSGIKENVLPAKAAAIVNARILPGDSVAGVVERARRVIGDDRIRIAPLPGAFEPSPISDPRSPEFRSLQGVIQQIAPHVLVAPALLVAATDSRHYGALSPNIFRFLPITIAAADARRFHGVNERISIGDYERCVRFFIQLLRVTAR